MKKVKLDNSILEIEALYAKGEGVKEGTVNVVIKVLTKELFRLEFLPESEEAQILSGYIENAEPIEEADYGQFVENGNAS